MFSFFRRDKKLEAARERAIAELTNFLVEKFGFSLEDAFRASVDFWKRWDKKLKEII